ncbi:MAG: TIGR03619 family F420-dependent LLM class oxidoreductase [Mycobacterium sp.]
MRIGLSTPVVIRVPGAASEWEHSAGVDDIARVAEAADEFGFDYLTCSEHIALPSGEQVGRGSTYWDPLATLSFLAARTSRIKLATSVLVLGYHHPLEIAKRYGTLDQLSGGRVVLGVGVGSTEEEFALLGASWADRGARADDALGALRASLSHTQPSYDGEFYSYGGLVVDPCALQPRVPIWVGGHTRRSLRRAATLGDGWMPFGLRGRDMAEMLASVDVPEGFDVVLATRPLDPSGQAEETLRHLRSLRDNGATAVTCSIAADSLTHYCDQLGALRNLVDNIDQEG